MKTTTMKKTTTKKEKSDKKPKAEKNPELHLAKQLLIEKFCKEESTNWPREMRNIAALLKKEPLEFWKFLVLGFKLNSLGWFNSENGKREIEKNKKIFAALQVKKAEGIKNDIVYVRQTESKKSLLDRLKD